MFVFSIFRITCNLLITRELLNILGVEMISKKWKIKFEKKNIQKLIFRYLIFVILKFRNIGRSTFRRFKFWLSPTNLLNMN